MKSIQPIKPCIKTYRNFIYTQYGGLNEILKRNSITYMNKLYDHNLRIQNENIFVQLLMFMNIDPEDNVQNVYANLLTKVNTIASHFGISCMYNIGKPIKNGFENNYEYYISKEYSKYPIIIPDEYRHPNTVINKSVLIPLFTSDTTISYPMYYEKRNNEVKDMSVYSVDLVGLGIGYYYYLTDRIPNPPISYSANNYVATYVYGNYNIYKNIHNLYNINYYQLLTNMDASRLIEYIKPMFNIIPFNNRDVEYLNRLHEFQLKQNVEDPYEVIYNAGYNSFLDLNVGQCFLNYNVFYNLHQTNWLLNLYLMREYSKSLIININNKIAISSITNPIYNWFINFDMGVLNTVPSHIKELYLKEMTTLKELLEINIGSSIRSKF